MPSVLLQLPFNHICMKLDCSELPGIFPRKSLIRKPLPQFRWYVTTSYVAVRWMKIWAWRAAGQISWWC